MALAIEIRRLGRLWSNRKIKKINYFIEKLENIAVIQKIIIKNLEKNPFCLESYYWEIMLKYYLRKLL